MISSPDQDGEGFDPGCEGGVSDPTCPREAQERFTAQLSAPALLDGVSLSIGAIPAILRCRKEMIVMRTLLSGKIDRPAASHRIHCITFVMCRG